MGGRGAVKIRLLAASVILSAIWLSLWLAVPSYAEDGIEQVIVNMPEVRVSYRLETEGELLGARLGDQSLELDQDGAFTETAAAIDYYVLVDISGSMESDRFQDIKESLKQFRSGLRSGDRMLLFSFGDQVNQVLKGDEDEEAANAAIEGLLAQDHNTVLFDALEEAADKIRRSAEESTSEDQVKRVIFAISDGKDCADNTKSTGMIEDLLTKYGIPAYTFAVENNEEDSEADRQNYRSQFSNLASASGGLAWTVDQLEGTDSGSIRSGLEAARSAILGSRVATFHGSSNRISNQEELLTMTFKDGKDMTRKVLVSGHQKDDTAPEVTGVLVNDSRSLILSYSEPVINADQASNYQIVGENGSLAVLQAAPAEKANTYTLICSEEFYNGEYSLKIQNVKDDSQEENALENADLTVKVTKQKDLDNKAPKVTGQGFEKPNVLTLTFSEEVNGATSNGSYQVTCDGKAETVLQVTAKTGKKYSVALVMKNNLRNGSYVVTVSGVEDLAGNTLADREVTIKIGGIRLDLKELIITWWPLVLTVLLLILLLLLLWFFVRLKKKKVTIINGRVVNSDNILEEDKIHVKGQRSLPRKQMTVWIGDGVSEPRQISKLVNGSMMIGRSSSECDIYCDDPMMSKQHFSLAVEKEGSVVITDLASTNGTSVNGIRITGETGLSSGDQVQAGNIQFRFEWE